MLMLLILRLLDHPLKEYECLLLIFGRRCEFFLRPRIIVILMIFLFLHNQKRWVLCFLPAYRIFLGLATFLLFVVRRHLRFLTHRMFLLTGLSCLLQLLFRILLISRLFVMALELLLIFRFPLLCFPELFFLPFAVLRDPLLGKHLFVLAV